MSVPINVLVERSIRELSKENEKRIRKFIERYRSATFIKYVNKSNLHLMNLYRETFLNEIEKRYVKGDMQFLEPRVYGYIRRYIKTMASSFLKQYMHIKKRNIV